MARSSLTIHGSASGMPNGGRVCSGYLIEHHDALTLLDCGSGVAASFLRKGFDLRRLDCVVISHTHPDHVSDLPLLIQYLHLAGKSSPIDFYLPREFETIFEQMIRAMYVIPERYAFDLRVHGYEPGVLCEQPFAIEAIGNSHLKSYESDVRRLGLPNRMQSFSLRVTVGGVTIVYSGDVASFGELKPHLDECHLLLLETSHVDIAEVKEYAAGYPGMRIVLTHLTGEDAASRLGREFEGLRNVQIAEDGMRVELG
ncbi:MAG: ribonuclease Z [candidate division Zixibacteria bacterium]|nr:ribonuclease Z [candidate division Zixibacteria bacterium]